MKKNLKTKKTPSPKKTSPLLPLLLVLLVGVLILAFVSILSQNQNKFASKEVNNNPDSKIVTNNQSSQIQSALGFEKYQKIDEVSANKNGNLVYKFTDGQPDRDNNHKNYTIEVPNSWEIYRYQNEKDRDDYGTNIILKKGNDFILIKQQLFESGSCVFEDIVEPVGMAYKCDLVNKLDRNDVNWKLYTLPQSYQYGETTTPQWSWYGICDQDVYSKGISSYTTPNEQDKKFCSPWTNVGEIGFYSSSGDSQNLEEFKKIVEGIKIQ